MSGSGTSAGGERLRVLIIGGTRFIGPPVVRSLVALGHEVTLFHRGTTSADLPAAVRYLHGDRTRLAAFAGALRAVAADVVIDMVAYTRADAEELVGVFRGGRVRRLVVISSLDVYRVRDRLFKVEPGAPDPTPLDEDAPLRCALYPYRAVAKDQADPKYAYDKIPVEQVVRENADLPATILRLPAVYGPGDFQHRTFEYLKRMDDGRRSILVDRAQLGWRWSRGYVENVAAAIVLAATDARAAGRTYNVGEEPALSIADWIAQIGRAASWNGRVCGMAEVDLPAHLRESGMDWRHDWAVNTGRIRRELGYVEPVTLRDALARTVAWERANPPAAVDAAQFDYAAEDGALARVMGSGIK
jgi:nucleoside-diphosphate-sugar epimerase